jgi:hypothetical protein
MLRQQHMRESKDLHMKAKAAIKSFLNIVATYAEQIKIFFAVFAALWIFFEYRGKQEESRVERSMEYVKRVGEDKLLDAEIKTTRYWLNPDIKKRLEAIKGDRKAFERLSIEGANQMPSDVWLFLNFYKGLSICVNSGLCDAETACARFGRDMEIFSENFNPYFELYREQFKDDVMRPLREMLTKKCAPSLLKHVLDFISW